MPLDQEDEFFESDPSEEGEEDIPRLDLNAIRSAVVSGSDWTTETILRQMRIGNIDLNPNFQRRDVWLPRRKSEFIESILLNLPIPQIVLAERRDDRNTFLVLDGKQRLLSLRQFAANPVHTAEDAPFLSLKLTGLTIRQDLNDATYATLKSTADRNAFDNHTIRTVVIRNWPDEDFLYRVFLRLNTGSVPLSPQELRQALNPGPFMDFVDSYAIDSEPVHRALGVGKTDRRMRDTELLIRHLAFVDRLEKYTGNLKPFLDDTCRYFSERWDSLADTVQTQVKDCEQAINVTIEIFGQRDAFTQWRADGRRRAPFNRAVFDIMTYFFCRQEVAERAMGEKERVVELFRALCEDDYRFQASLGTTTKSIASIAYRLVTWGHALENLLGIHLAMPAWLQARAAE